MLNKNAWSFEELGNTVSEFVSDPAKHSIFDPLADSMAKGLSGVIHNDLRPELDEAVKGIGTELQKATAMGVGALAIAQPLMSRIMPTKVQMEGGGGNQSNPMQRGFRMGLRSPNFTGQFKSAPTGQ